MAEILFKGENRELRVNVFQELNDKGKDLSTTDKIKARIVSLFQDSDQYEVSVKLEVWESILENFNGKSERVEDFLVYFIAATENPESLTEARDNVLDLFRLNEVGNPVFPPQLTDQEEGSQFLTKLRRFSDRFTEIEHNDLSGGENPLEEEPRKRAEEIIRRLHDLNTSQWIPFVLYLYDDVSSTPGKSQFFRDVLKTVENITFRVSLTELNATVVDDTYIDATAAFKQRKEDDDLNTYDTDACRAILLDNVPDRRQLTGTTFIQNLIREYDWQNNKTKQLFLKIVDEGFEDEGTGMTRRELDDKISVELEHIFPVQFIRKWDADDNPTASDSYSWLDDFFFATTDPIDASETVISDYIQTIKREDAAEISESDPVYDQLSRIIDQIESLFVRDIGNMMILVGGLNRSVLNKRFSVKFHAYHNSHPEDLNNRINNYFSRSNMDLSEETLDDTLIIDYPDGYDDTDLENAVEGVFNGWWNINRLIERKAALIAEILNSLEFSTDDKEFDIQTEDVREETINDIRNRCNQPT